MFSRRAEKDLAAIYRYIASESYPVRAREFTRRIYDFCADINLFERGHRRDDVSKGLRVLGFEKRVTVVIRIQGQKTVIVRIFYGGMDWESRAR